MARMVNLLFSFGETGQDVNSSHVNKYKHILKTSGERCLAGSLGVQNM